MFETKLACFQTCCGASCDACEWLPPFALSDRIRFHFRIILKAIRYRPRGAGTQCCGRVCAMCTVLWSCVCDVHSAVVVCVRCTQCCGRVFAMYTVLWSCVRDVHSAVVVCVRCTQCCGRVCAMYTVVWSCVCDVHSGVVVCVPCCFLCLSFRQHRTDYVIDAVCLQS